MAASQLAFGTLTSDAEFRTWGQTLSTALAAMGLVKTADTGQIDFTTVARPAVANTAAGYEIWRFADSLQSSAPVFIKIEYGTGSSATAVGIWITVGTATNGAGSITGTQLSTRKQAAGAQAAIATTTSYISGATDRIGFAYNTGGGANQEFGFHVERSKDAAGANTSAGVCTYVHSGNSTYNAQEQFVPFTGNAGAMTGELQPYAFCAPGTTGVFGTDVGTYPHFPFVGKLLNPKLGLLTYMTADITGRTTFGVSMYGSSHTYMALDQAMVYAAGGYYPGRGGGAANCSLAMRYE